MLRPPNVTARPSLHIRETTSNRTPLTADARPERGSQAVGPRGVLLYSDKTLTCADCGQQFVFTASEQDFYAQRGFTEPRRCPTHPAPRKPARQSSGAGYSSGYGEAGSYGGGGGRTPSGWHNAPSAAG